MLAAPAPARAPTALTSPLVISIAVPALPAPVAAIPVLASILQAARLIQITPEDESGVAHLPEGGMRRVTYSLSTSKLSVSPALSALTQHNISFFDEYGRDFQMPLATYAPSYRGAVQSWIRTSSVRNEYVLSHGANLSSALSAQGYDPMNPSMADIQWAYELSGRQWKTRFHFWPRPGT